mgnify:CR=1 FL=1
MLRLIAILSTNIKGHDRNQKDDRKSRYFRKKLIGKETLLGRKRDIKRYISSYINYSIYKEQLGNIYGK